MAKTRIDVYLYDNKMVTSRSLAQRLVMAGEVLVNGERVLKPSQKIDEDSKVELIHKPQFVSRGGEKLDAGLKQFGLLDLSGKICADVGSSTGGFTDCLLQYGAEKVYSIDVGYGILHWKLRNHPKVVVMERMNARDITSLPDPINFVTIDASFISLKILLPVIKNWITNQCQIMMLIKPQFEAGRKDAAKGSGVIRNHEVHHKILCEIIGFSLDIGFQFEGLTLSPLKGPKGNIEFLCYLTYDENANSNNQEMKDLALENITSIIDSLP
ncbi:MAG TPA: TlyA family RNA methyltransferase [Anaerolineaceae bacterium]|nr:TlyA family RNA methyltransferase [Anaerolineaceae bacterium]